MLLLGTGAVILLIVAAVAVTALRGDTEAGPLVGGSPPPYDPAAAPAADLPTPPPGAERFARITDIEVQTGAYVTYAVSFETLGFEPILDDDHNHLHFFFDTVPETQSGVPGAGPWTVWPERHGEKAESPFTGFRLMDVPRGATGICVIVANPDHTVVADTGTCWPLP